MGPNRLAADEELAAERRRREELEQEVRRLTAQNEEQQRRAEEGEQLARLRDGLQERGVKKSDLALKLLKDDVRRGEEGRLYGESNGVRLPLDEYLDRFVAENPEFLPPRIAGGSGASPTERGMSESGVEMESIRPGMSADEARKAWKEVARLMGKDT